MMTAASTVAPLASADLGGAVSKPKPDLRIGALRRFATAITFLNVVGHLFLGFEPSYAHPFMAVALAYTLELGFEVVGATSTGRRPAFLGRGFIGLVDFLLPAHITALACAMLLYTGETFAPVAFAVAVAIGSKFIFRAPVGKGQTRHFLNPSNTGIAVTVIVFRWVSVSPGYQFTESIPTRFSWAVPLFVIMTGSLLNSKFTRKMPLILAWAGGFVVQALLRSAFLDFRLLPALTPMIGMAVILFSFYMLSDPGTTPTDPKRQVLFGFSVAMAYGVCDILNLPYQIFFALIAVCTARGALLHAMAWREARAARASRAESDEALALEASASRAA